MDLTVIADWLEQNKPNCGHTDECFSQNGAGWLAYETPLENAMGGRWFAECHCATDEHRAHVAILQPNSGEGD
jgi:hypothetical protein